MPSTLGPLAKPLTFEFLGRKEVAEKHVTPGWPVCLLVGASSPNRRVAGLIPSEGTYN